jgi:hypothetical protein
MDAHRCVQFWKELERTIFGYKCEETMLFYEFTNIPFARLMDAKAYNDVMFPPAFGYGQALGPYGPSAGPAGYAPPPRRDGLNRVDRDRIQQGMDVRTTIMLRNIPNKMDWLALKTLLEKVCGGSYDFIYLRIDFDTASNVGYAFINFTNTDGLIGMINFVESNPSWGAYRSSKRAEISYATIQGKEALIQKFRNSSVMLEAPYCRPRLFYSREDAFAMGDMTIIGQEAPFPGADNAAKLQRSIDNARQVGLFPPNRDPDHRHRQSSYDSGNPRDLIARGEIQAPGPIRPYVGAVGENVHFNTPLHQVPVFTDHTRRFLGPKYI